MQLIILLWAIGRQVSERCQQEVQHMAEAEKNFQYTRWSHEASTCASGGTFLCLLASEGRCIHVCIYSVCVCVCVRMCAIIRFRTDREIKVTCIFFNCCGYLRRGTAHRKNISPILTQKQISLWICMWTQDTKKHTTGKATLNWSLMVVNFKISFEADSQ